MKCTKIRLYSTLLVTFFVTSLTPITHAADAKIDPSGTWKWERTFGDNTVEFVLKLTSKDGKIVGTYKGGRGEATNIEGAEVDGKNLSFVVTREFNDRRFIIKLHGEVGEDDIKGAGNITLDSGDREFEWVAKRSTELADIMGQWNFSIETANGNVIEPSITFSTEGDKVHGVYISRSGEQNAKNIKLEKNKLTFEISGTRDDFSYKFVYLGKPRGNSIAGKVDYDFNGNTGEIDFKGKRAPKKKDKD